MSAFKHSIKVPTQYKKTAAALKIAFEKKKSLKNLIYEEKHARIRSMHAVLKQYCDNCGSIDAAIEKSEILKENLRLCPFLCKILVTELLFGRKKLIGNSKPVETVKAYHKRLLEALGDVIPVNQQQDQIIRKVKKPRYVRINTNVISLENAYSILHKDWIWKEFPPFENYDDFLKAVQELDEHECMLDMHIESLLIFHPKTNYFWAINERVKDMTFLLQDKGTALVAELLQPPPESVVLDMCAAPGMKTIHLSNIMKNQGKIYAVDRDPHRFKILRERVNLAGCKNVQTIFSDAFDITSEQCPNVEYILIDPSCSGSGMAKRIELDHNKTTSERLKKLGGLQIKLLSYAMSTFPHVKRIVYSTCSLHEDENEHVIQRALQFNSNFKLLSCKKALRNKWINVGNPEYQKIGKNCLYSKPERDLTDGIFIAMLEKIKTK